MRRRYTFAVVLLIALIFSAGGTIFGRYVVPHSSIDTGQCVFARAVLERGQPDPNVNGFIQIYDQSCR